MRINEITDINQSWASLKDIDFKEMYNTVNTIKQFWPSILNTKSPTLIATHKKNLKISIDVMEDILLEVDNFPELNDPDLLKIKQDIPNLIMYLRSLL